MGLSIGLFIAWQLAFPRVSDLRERMRQRPQYLFKPNLRSDITPLLPYSIGHTDQFWYRADYPWVWIMGSPLEDGCTLYPLGPNDSHPFHMQNTFTPSQGPPKSHPNIVLVQSEEYCHLSQVWVQMRLSRCSFLHMYSSLGTVLLSLQTCPQTQHAMFR